MSHEPLTLDDLAKQLGRDVREIEKLANRGRLPGRKQGGNWIFHPTEITQWLESEMRAYTERELAHVEEAHRSDVDEDLLVSRLLHPETVEVPLQARTKRSALESPSRSRRTNVANLGARHGIKSGHRTGRCLFHSL